MQLDLVVCTFSFQRETEKGETTSQKSDVYVRVQRFSKDSFETITINNDLFSFTFYFLVHDTDIVEFKTPRGNPPSIIGWISSPSLENISLYFMGQ